MAPSSSESGSLSMVESGLTFPGNLSGIARFVVIPPGTPPLRKLAKSLGVDLGRVTGSGTSGKVTRRDVILEAQRPSGRGRSEAAGQLTSKTDARIGRIAVRGARKATAAAMVASAFTAPHVSIFLEVDATRTMELVRRLKSNADFSGVKVSPLLILAKAVLWAVKRNPEVNSTWSSTEIGDEIHVKDYVNLGIAAASPRGLLVPNVKDAQHLNLPELAAALSHLTAKARSGKTQPADMQGGTLTITNIGTLGLDAGTPILNPGEVAIVAFGAIRQKPWLVEGKVVPRWITTLSGSFDHRVVDGDKCASFLRDAAAILGEPALLLG